MKPIAQTLFAAALALGVAPPLAAKDAPASQESPPDDRRLALAETTVGYIWPAGTYERMMRGTMDKMMDSLMGSMFNMPLSSLEPGRQGAEGTIAELAAIRDPHFKERMSRSTHAMMSEMIPLMNELEPGIREGLAQAYARKYTAAQLADMNAFFATPTGSAYARDAYVMFMDPAVMEKIQGFMPAMMKRMPAMIEKMKAATADLPPPRRLEDLSDAEKARVAAIEGKSVAELEAEGDQGWSSH